MQTRILLLEDDDSFRVLVQETLEDADFQVTACPNAADAIRAAQWNDFELFLTDVRMGGEKDGIDAADAILKMHPKMVCIVMTGYTETSDPSRALRINVHEFISKSDLTESITPDDPDRTPHLVRHVVRVLVTEQRRKSYLEQFANVFRSSGRLLARLMGKPDPDELRARVDDARMVFFRQYFVAMNPRRLSWPASLRIWDRLVLMEQGYDSSTVDMAVLLKAYQSLCETVQADVQNLATANSANRPAEAVPLKTFRTMYERVAERKIQGEAELSLAPLLWLKAARKAKLTPVESKVWQRLFG